MSEPAEQASSQPSRRGPDGSSKPLRAVLYIVASMAVLSLSDAGAKWLAPHYPVAEIMFVRQLVGLPLAIAVVAATRGRGGFRTRFLGAHIIRTGLMLVAWAAFIYALRSLPLGDAFTIAFCSPLFMTLFGFVFLREQVPALRWGAVAVGFVGVVIVLQPSGTGLGPAAIAALGAAFTWALSTIWSRKIAVAESSETMLFVYMALATAALALGLPTYDLSLRPGDLWVFGVAGVSGVAGHWLLAYAFRYGELSLLAVFEYTALVWALLFGFWIWGDRPNPTVLLGASLIIGSGIAIARMESRRARPDPGESEAAVELPV